jgi:hypothetical protein
MHDINGLYPCDHSLSFPLIQGLFLLVYGFGIAVMGLMCERDDNMTEVLTSRRRYHSKWSVRGFGALA